MELDHWQQRIVQLEGSNNSLTELVTRLVEIVEKTADDAAEDPVYSAGAAASDIVDRYVGGRPVNDEPEISGPELEGGRNARPITEAQAFDGPAGRVENIEDEFLLAEDLYEKSKGASEFPKLVYDAVALFRGEDVEVTGAQPADEQIDIPEPMTSQVELSAPEGDLDIKEIMARLEIAAERAQVRADEDARLDQVGLEDLVGTLRNASDWRSRTGVASPNA